MIQAGLADAEEQALQFAPRLPAGIPFWEAQVEMGIGHRLARATETERAALDAALRAGFGRYIEGGFYHLVRPCPPRPRRGPGRVDEPEPRRSPDPASAA